jgi:hypothetical protein
MGNFRMSEPIHRRVIVKFSGKASTGGKLRCKGMNATVFALARENRMPIIVFSIREPGAIAAVLGGKGHATFVGS